MDSRATVGVGMAPRRASFLIRQSEQALFADEGFELFERFFRMAIEISRCINNVTHDTLGVDQVGHPRGDAPLFVENPPGLARSPPGEVAEQGEFDAQLARVRAGGER